MVQPNLLSVDLIKRLSAKVSGFQVPQCSDHAPDGIFRLNTDKAVRRFRQLKPDLEGVVRVENRHGKIKYPQPTQAQIDVIIGWWWDTSIKRSAVEAKVSAMLNADIPHHKIRDWVAKATGSPARQLHQFYAENIWKDAGGPPDLLDMLQAPDPVK